MSQNAPAIPTLEIDEQLAQKIAGGSCTAEEYVEVIEQLKESYDALVDFTSYVIERVVTSTTN
jgi:hypothetical protein